MSKFVNPVVENIEPYIPGEQPQDRSYIKLNTNENPYFLSNKAISSIDEGKLQNLRRYCDPECNILVDALSDYYQLPKSFFLPTNGSDEALSFAFQCYGQNGVKFPDITYGFYSVFANLYQCKKYVMPLEDDYKINIQDYCVGNQAVILANPNAQTGLALKRTQIEQILKANEERIVIIDQAYYDFANEDVDAIPLIKSYDNLVVICTFSKSRSLAGGRIGYVIAQPEIIQDLKKIKYSFNPYNINTVSQILATKALKDHSYFIECVQKIITTRERVISQLKERNFYVLQSNANFILAKHTCNSGESLYQKLKNRGVLVRHFNDIRIQDFIRITIGTDEEMDLLIQAIDEIIGEII